MNLWFRGEGTVTEPGKVMYTVPHSQWTASKGPLCAEGALLGPRGSLDGRGFGEKGFTDMHGWVPQLFTWNYQKTVTQLYSNTKFNIWKKINRPKNIKRNIGGHGNSLAAQWLGLSASTVAAQAQAWLGTTIPQASSHDWKKKSLVLSSSASA